MSTSNAKCTLPPFLQLPPELHASIAPLLSPHTLLRLTRTSKALVPHYQPELWGRATAIFRSYLSIGRTYKLAVPAGTVNPSPSGENDPEPEGAWSQMAELSVNSEPGSSSCCQYQHVERWVARILLRRSGSLECLRFICIDCGAWDELEKMQALILVLIRACGRGFDEKIHGDDADILDLLTERALKLETALVVPMSSSDWEHKRLIRPRVFWPFIGSLLVRKARLDLLRLFWNKDGKVFSLSYDIFEQCEQNLRYTVPCPVDIELEISEPNLQRSCQDRMKMTQYLFDLKNQRFNVPVPVSRWSAMFAIDQAPNPAIAYFNRGWIEHAFQQFCYGVADAARRKDYLREPLPKLSSWILRFLISQGLDLSKQEVGKVFHVLNNAQYDAEPELLLLRESGSFLFEILTNFGWRWDGTKDAEVELIFKLCEPSNKPSTYRGALEYLIRQHGVPVDIRRRTNGHTPLMAAIVPLVAHFSQLPVPVEFARRKRALVDDYLSNQTDVVRALMRNGANPMAIDYAGKMSPIAIMAAWGYGSLLRLLVDGDVRRVERYGRISTARVIENWFEDKDFWSMNLPRPLLSREEIRDRFRLSAKIYGGPYRILTREEYERENHGGILWH